ncbi:MAG: hypothetical protein HY074_08860 [Deltaproteobacteria bacterium]|nr:hypothetical protein [Deltaproteobacteria bacterium]
MKFYSYALAMTVAAGITLSGLKPAYGELVFEDDLNQKPVVKTESTEVPKAQKLEDTGSKAEVMRRSRLREELKNEDLLTQKLEELRLKDELKRTDDLLGSGVSKGASAPEAPMQEQRVGTAAAPAPATAPANAQLNAPVTITGAPIDASTSSGKSVANADATEEKAEKPNRITVTPRFGTGSITNSIYNVSAKFAAGLAVGMELSDNFSITGGYTYASYALGAGTSLYSPYGYNQSSYQQTINLNDNVIDLGAKASLFGRQSRIRPFLGGGAAYRMGYVNYDSTTQAALARLNTYSAQDVSITGFAAYIEAGLDVKITDLIAITGNLRYFNMLSSKQSNPVDPNAFVNSGYYNNYGYGMASNLGYNNSATSAAGSALASQNFYQAMVGLSVSF